MEKNDKDGIRINKYISDYGFCSRREADKLIEDERVTINNRLATPGDKVGENDTVRTVGGLHAMQRTTKRASLHARPDNVVLCATASAHRQVPSLLHNVANRPLKNLPPATKTVALKTPNANRIPLLCL